MTTDLHGPPEGRSGRLGHLVRRGWRRLLGKKLTASDNYDLFDRFYAMEDPWELSAGRDQVRFAQTNALIASRLGRVGSLLEIGCGEGHQSALLSQVCDRLVGIDVSERAVSRARARVPGGEFRVGDVASLGSGAGRFDLVVAFEMLYYVKDIPATLARMSELGDACLVTFFAPAARIVAQHLASVPLADRGWMFGDPYAWLYAFWRPAASPAQGTSGTPVNGLGAPGALGT
jgi:SAM-dependent methyltransferase